MKLRIKTQAINLRLWVIGDFLATSHNSGTICQKTSEAAKAGKFEKSYKAPLFMEAENVCLESVTENIFDMFCCNINNFCYNMPSYVGIVDTFLMGFKKTLYLSEVYGNSIQGQCHCLKCTNLNLTNY